MVVRKEIRVSGIVQGVGFRPYIYRLASERRLAGSIRNTAAGVTIQIQGPPLAVDEFLACLPVQAPPLARITDVAVCELPCNGDQGFRIAESQGGEKPLTLISPDVAVCEDCRRELFDPGDRRYRYPFINCTNCGPRFTIVRDIPYDRPLTSMAAFSMCPACQAEYDDPGNRRFHAQPNACWTCGPQVELWDARGRRIETADPIAEVAAALKAGAVAAIKGLGGFHLAADATNPSAVELLRARKHRAEKPFATMVPSLEIAERFCLLEPGAREALESIHRPIVLLRRKKECAVVDAVAPFHRDLGLFLPYAPLHYLLLEAGSFVGLVMTSGNQSEEPIAIDNREAVQRLGGLADYLLVHNRDILLRCDDSVVRVVGRQTCQLRRSRGFVPVPVFLQREVPPILAVGGELKNTICLTRGRHAFLSQHIGDLENLEGFKFFDEAVEHLQRILEIRPQAIAHDLHPDYFSTKWARARPNVPLIGVQHHHAHIASCMAENHLDGRVIGFALDGTGYGSDGHIWGGEVLTAGYADFQRAAHLEYVPMPGGAAAIREPWRMAVSYLALHYGRDFLDLQIPFMRGLDRRKTESLLRMLEQRVNSPLASSCGRLFDAVAALAGLRQNVTYEGQAAIALEMAMTDSNSGDAYPLELHEESSGRVITTRVLFRELLRDLAAQVPVGVISRRFHNGLVEVLAQVAARLRQKEGWSRVCLSGGTFQNRYLLERLRFRLEEDGFEVFSHRDVPPGDGGLSLGQAMVAAHRLDKSTSRA